MAVDGINYIEVSSKKITVPAFDKLNISYGFEGYCNEPDGHRTKQVHGADIVEANHLTHDNVAYESKVLADGIWTKQSNSKVGIVTADCLPLLVADQRKQLICAAHAGWRGLTKGILINIVNTFQNNNISPPELIVAIGPSICRDHYEVGPEVREAVLNMQPSFSSEQLTKSIKEGQGDRCYVGLNILASFHLINLGLKPQHISLLTSCTFEQVALWPSYRRKKENTGRIWNWIKR